ncbi:hypothetical protein EJB05_18638, partial [Eragrostis curvula]
SCAGKPVVGRLLPGSVAPRAGPCRLRALHVKPLAVTPERVRLLPVRRVVADLELFVGHAQRDEEADTEQDDRGDHDVPCDDEERAAELFAELSGAAAVEGAARSRDVRVERGEVRGGEEAREDAAEEPGDGVRVEDGEGVVHLLEEVGLLVEDHHGDPRHAAGAYAHQYGRPCVHQSCMCDFATCASGDADQPGHHALHRANHRGLAEEDDVEAGPCQKARRGTDIGVEHGDGRGYVGGVRRAAIEPCPTQPQQPTSGDHEQDVVGCEPLPVALQPRTHLPRKTQAYVVATLSLTARSRVPPDSTKVQQAPFRRESTSEHRSYTEHTYPVGGGEAGDAGGEVDDVSAGVIDDAPVVEEAAAPEAERADGVGEEQPQRRERHPRLDVHAPEQRPGEQHQRDGRELELEQHQRRLRVERLQARRHERAVVAVVLRGRERRAADEERLRQRRPGLAPERQQPLAKRHAEADEHPDDERGRVGVQRHEGGVHGPFLLHDAAVEHDKPRHGLDAHERGRRQLPRVVAFVQPLRHRREVRRVGARLWRRGHFSRRRTVKSDRALAGRGVTQVHRDAAPWQRCLSRCA